MSKLPRFVKRSGVSKLPRCDGDSGRDLAGRDGGLALPPGARKKPDEDRGLSSELMRRCTLFVANSEGVGEAGTLSKVLVLSLLLLDLMPSDAATSKSRAVLST